MSEATNIEHRDAAILELERKIQAALIDLENNILEPVGETIDSIFVDTRNFANLAVEIHLAKRGKK